MTVARLAKNVSELSERMDERFELLDRRFEALHAGIQSELRNFTSEVKRHFDVSLEGMDIQLKLTLDRAAAQEDRLDAFEHANAEEHRLVQAQIDDLDAKLRSRPRRRRPS